MRLHPPRENLVAGSKAVGRAPWKLITTLAAGLAGIAALITNIDTIADLFTPSVAGAWQITETIKKSTYMPYIGERATYRVTLYQDGSKVSGTGEKIMVNDKQIPPSQKQPLEIIGGNIEGGELKVSFKLEPAPDKAARETRGEFNWHVVRGGIFKTTAIRLEGTFWGTVADTQGDAVAVRWQP
jgi:hypothetical protein